MVGYFLVLFVRRKCLLKIREIFVEMFIDILNFLNYKEKHRLYTHPMACAQKYQLKKGKLNFKANRFEILSYWDSTDHGHYQQGCQENKTVYVLREEHCKLMNKFWELSKWWKQYVRFKICSHVTRNCSIMHQFVQMEWNKQMFLKEECNRCWMEETLQLVGSIRKLYSRLK